MILLFKQRKTSPHPPEGYDPGKIRKYPVPPWEDHLFKKDENVEPGKLKNDDVYFFDYIKDMLKTSYPKILYYLDKYTWIMLVIGIIIGMDIGFFILSFTPREYPLRKGEVYKKNGYTYGIAWDYTNLDFWYVHKGMTRRKVYEVLGPPMATKRSANWEVWCYALEYPADKPLRRFILFRDGKVREKVSTGWIIP